jgi:Glycosyl transferase family 2
MTARTLTLCVAATLACKARTCTSALSITPPLTRHSCVPVQGQADPDDDIHAIGPQPAHGNVNRLPKPVPPRHPGCPAPLVSIVLNVYNAAAHLDECLQGVLNQTHRPLELAVCNNNSTDDSGAVLEAWRPRLEARGIRYTCVVTRDDDGQGCGLARNRAIAIASGPQRCDIMRASLVLRMGRPSPAGCDLKMLQCHDRVDHVRHRPRGETCRRLAVLC